MRSISLTLAILLAGFANVHAAGEAAISDTTCYDKNDKETAKNLIASTEDCEGAINKVYDLSKSGGGTSGPVGSGCNEVATSGGCSVSICNMNTRGTTVSYGAIASAAQWIHAICKGNPSTKTTGGNNKVQGYQQPGETHSEGMVLLAKKLSSKKRGMQDGSRIVARSANDEPAVTRRDDNEEQGTVTGTNHVFRRNFVHNVEGGLEELNPQDFRRLQDRFITNWNLQTGHSTIVTAAITVNNVDYTLSFVAHNNADITRIARDNRVNEVAAFMRLRARNNNPTTFSARLEVDDGTALGTMMLLEVDRTPSVGHFFGVTLHVSGAF